MPKNSSNQAFIDAQNLYYNIKTISKNAWNIDLRRFRVHLKDKYHVDKAYYFMGAYRRKNSTLYQNIRDAGYQLVFREHNLEMSGSKKGNVDTDIVFSIMKKLVEQEDFCKVVLVSGDGDYFRMVKYLIEKDKLAKILAPSWRSFSSLYKTQLDFRHYAFLDNPGVRHKITTPPTQN